MFSWTNQIYVGNSNIKKASGDDFHQQSDMCLVSVSPASLTNTDSNLSFTGRKLMFSSTEKIHVGVFHLHNLHSAFHQHLF